MSCISFTLELWQYTVSLEQREIHVQIRLVCNNQF